MKQAPKTVIPPSHTSTSNISMSLFPKITKEERIVSLSKSSKDAPLNMSRKKKLIYCILELWADIEEKSKFFDKKNRSQLGLTIGVFIPQSKTWVKSMNNKELVGSRESCGSIFIDLGFVGDTRDGIPENHRISLHVWLGKRYCACPPGWVQRGNGLSWLWCAEWQRERLWSGVWCAGCYPHTV